MHFVRHRAVLQTQIFERQFFKQVFEVSPCSLGKVSVADLQVLQIGEHCKETKPFFVVNCIHHHAHGVVVHLERFDRTAPALWELEVAWLGFWIRPGELNCQLLEVLDIC